MSVELKKTKKELNKDKVATKALEFFIKYGIENSKVSDIAKAAGVTERSAFRYFETKNDLVLQSALLFWKKAVEKIDREVYQNMDKSMKGIDKVRFVMSSYVELFFTSNAELIFCDEAETYLYRSGKNMLIENRPPIAFEKSNDPLAKAIKDGMNDKTVRNDEDIPFLYLNTYDGLLGLMQKLALSGELVDKETARTRLNLFIESMVKMYQV